MSHKCVCVELARVCTVTLCVGVPEMGLYWCPLGTHWFPLSDP